jgi:succinate dehydrogenase / fumarate reductase flavoprotein subunit
LGGNSLSDLLVFGKRAGEFAAEFARQNSSGSCDGDQVEEAARRALAPFERLSRSPREGPFQVQQDLQEVMQDLVGIVRTKAEMVRALEIIGSLRERAGRVTVDGHREYNPAWHTALDLPNLLTVAEVIARSALERRESRGAHFRADYPSQDERLGKVNLVIRKGPDGEVALKHQPIPPLPSELQRIVEEMQ